MKENVEEKEKKKQERLKEIVLMKMATMPQHYKLSIGNEGVFDKNQIIEHVDRMDTIGKQILDMELKFIKALSRGEITKTLVSG